jgi:ABC-2 type transport system permease protein
MSGSLIFLILLFFLFGFFSYAFILAGFACTVSRMEEVNTVVVIPMMLIAGAFYVALIGSMTPTAGFVTVCSFIPFLSPLVMFMRICVTDVPFIEILAACAINSATVLCAAFVCSRIYRVGVMLYGKKPRVKDIIRYVIKA